MKVLLTCVYTSQWRLRIRQDRGVTGWYQSLGSHILSTSRWQINGKDICNWNAWVLVIQSNYKCRVIYPFLLIYFLILKPSNLLLSSFFLSPEFFNLFPSSFILFPTSTNSSMERRGTRNGAGTSQDGSNRDNDGMMRILPVSYTHLTLPTIYSV